MGKRPRVLPSKGYKVWHEAQDFPLRAAKQQYAIDTPLEHIKHATVHFGAGSRHKYDLSNKLESIMDRLVDAKILKDDNYEVVPDIRLVFDGNDKERGHYCHVTFWA